MSEQTTNETEILNETAEGFSMKDMIESGMQHGHKKSQTNPKMIKYIVSHSSTGSIINLNISIERLKLACEFINKILVKKQNVILVGIQANAKEIVSEFSKKTGFFYVNYKWTPGLLTNFSTTKQNLEKKRKLEDIVKTYEAKRDQSLEKKNIVTKKKYLKILENLNKLNHLYSGIVGINYLPGLIVLLQYRKGIIEEAKKLQIPVILLCDTDGDPTYAEEKGVLIPGNDDSIKSLSFVLNCLEKLIVSFINSTDIKKPYNPDIKKPYNPDFKRPYDPDFKRPYNPDFKRPYNPDLKKPYNPDLKKPYNPDSGTNDNTK